MRTKIAVTIGPSSSEFEMIKAMLRLNVSAFRINFSHGDVNTWKHFLDNIRDASNSIGKDVALIGDLAGPSIRLGELDEKIYLSRGDYLRIIHSTRAEGGSSKVAAIPLMQFFKEVNSGDILLMDDGRIKLVVEESLGSEILAKSITTAEISSNKAIVVKGKELDLPTISERDYEALRFAVSNELDYVGLSYVRGRDDVETLRRMLESLGCKDMGVISKIETVKAVMNLNEIVEASDALLVARGDLGMHFGIEEVPRLQERIVNVCLEKGKPVIVATQLLTSMMESTVPTRSEVVDVLTAIRESVDMLMLTGETAIGKNPLDVVEWLNKIIEVYDPITLPSKIKLPQDADIRDRFVEGITFLAESLGACIAVYTKSGKTAMRISRSRPYVDVYASSNDPKVIRKISILWGIRPIRVSSQNYFEGLDETLRILKNSGRVKKGDIVVLTYGLRDEPIHLVKIIQVS